MIRIFPKAWTAVHMGVISLATSHRRASGHTIFQQCDRRIARTTGGGCAPR